MDFSIFLTEQAKKHFQALTQSEKIIQLGLKKTGCSGYSYDLSILSKSDLKQPTQQFQGLSFYVKEEDKKAFNNCVIDYKREGLNYKVVFDNPNSKNECGCGESFSLAV